MWQKVAYEFGQNMTEKVLTASSASPGNMAKSASISCLHSLHLDGGALLTVSFTSVTADDLKKDDNRC